MSDPELLRKPRPKQKKKAILTTRERILIGGLGALTPVLLNLLVVDIENVFSKLTLSASIGYSLRLLVLIYAGGIIAYLHKAEHDAFKLFELGITAPALFMMLANGTEARSKPPLQQEVTQETGSSVGSFEIIPAAYAQQPPTSSTPSEFPEARNQDIKTFSPPQETVSEQFLRGFLGSTSKRIWYVVVGSYKSLDNAKREAERINKRYDRRFLAEVYEPYDTPNYNVVIGANLTVKEATALKQRALASRVVPDVYIKRGPDA